ncbi:MAG TPA: hypothetical protein VFA92_15340 [Candidatus Binatia bacterium]|nr:hypothetical protein [Candidatus Binatia bacterium]
MSPPRRAGDYRRELRSRRDWEPYLRESRLRALGPERVAERRARLDRPAPG